MLAVAETPPELTSAGIVGGNFELVFDQPMLTWATPNHGDALRTTPEAACGWYWVDDTTLACDTGGMGTEPLRKATPYQVQIGERLWSQAGQAFEPTTVTLVSSPPSLDATTTDWRAGLPAVLLRSSQPLAAADIRAVVDARFENETIDYSLERVEPGQYDPPDSVTYRWMPTAWPARPGRLRLSLRQGLRSPLGPALGDADESLLDVAINMPFRLLATSCASHGPHADSTDGALCSAQSDVLLLFSRAPSDASLERVAAALPKGLVLAEEPRDCDYRCYGQRSRNDAPAHAIRLASTLAGTTLAFELPAGLDANDGSRLTGKTEVRLDVASHPPGYRIEPSVHLALPGSNEATRVESRNPEGRDHWKELSIGRRTRLVLDRLVVPAARETYGDARSPDPAWGVLRHGGLSLGGVVDGAEARATALPAFQLLVNRHGPDLLAWATEWADAGPVPGARLDVLALSPQGKLKVVASAQTDADGVALLSLPEPVAGQDVLQQDVLHLLRATQGRRVTVLPLHATTGMKLRRSDGEDAPDWYRPPRPDTSPAFGVTDRLLYRPGDTVNFRLWQRERQLNTLRRIAPGTETELALSVPSDRPVRTWTAVTDAWGSIAGEVALPANLRDGGYCIGEADSLAHAWSPTGACFEVRRFETQAMWATLALPTRVHRPGEQVSMAIEGGYYSGGPAADAPLHVSGLLVPMAFEEAYPDFAGFTFIEPAAHEASEADPFKDLEVPRTVDGKGRAEVELTLPTRLEHDDGGEDDSLTPLAFAQIRVNAALMVGGESGAFSPTANLRIAAFDRYVGLRSEGDWHALGETPVLEAVVVGFDGKSQPGRRVEVRLEDGDEQDAELLGRCTLVAGTASPCDIAVPRPGYYVFVAESEGAAPTRLGRWFGRYAPDDEDEALAELSLVQASDGHSPARVRLRQPHARASALFVLEYDRVIRHWTQSVGTETEIDVPVSSELAPGVTLRVMLRPALASAGQGLDAKTIDAAMRLAIPRAGSDGLALSVADDSLAPSDSLRLALHNRSDQARLVVLSVVDDAVHQQMAALHPSLDPGGPDFLGSLSTWGEGGWHGLEAWQRIANPFRSRSSLRQEPVAFARPAPADAASDSLDTIEVTGSRLKRSDIFNEEPAYEVLERAPATAPGRDGPRVRSQFPDAAYWSPGIELAPGERRELSISLPDNLTRWRVLAWSGDQADGFDLSQATATTTLPVELRFGLPARLFDGDRAEASVSARNASDTPQRVALQVAVDGAGIARIDEASAMLSPFAALSRPVPLAPTEPDSLDVLARAETERGNDALSSRVPVQSRWSEVMVPQVGWLVSPVSLPLPALPDDAHTPHLQVRVSAGTAAWRAGWLRELRDYPHRCWEQTLSRALGAALALQDAADRADWPDAQAVIDEALGAAPGFMDEQGHFHFFPPARPWDVTGDLLLDAHTLRQFGWLRRLGQAVPDGLHDDLRDDVAAQATRVAEAKDRTGLEALAVGVAALAAEDGDPPAAALQRLWQDWNHLSWHARSELVQAMSVAPDFAESFRAGLQRLYAAGESRGLRRTIRDPRSFGWAMGSDLRDQCAVTAALWSLDASADRLPERQAFLRGLQYLYAGGTSSLDTQASLHCLLALRAVDAARGSVATAATVALEHGPTSSTLVLDGQGAGAGWQGVAEASELALKPLGGDSATLNYVAQLSYRQDQARVEARGVGLNIERRYSVLRDGRWQALSGTSARRGEWIRVTLQLQVPALRHFVAITDTVPGGWATRDVGLAGVAGANVREVADPGSWWFDTRQTGATEVRLYAESLPPGTHEVHYFAQAQHPGRYFAPPAVAELMYGRASRANTAGDWVEIQP
ncbi:hypothetical protein N788_04665 [Arenimonas donghaensis DSM 18148 = HO3-R19]|uniref:Alpha-2-macroglobulin domain-containing protein n=2 Tax=Arenimonas TaxID=490567 RepID=A0A087MH31_9GAMM|nr:hypothetical protein N788_04665 [Arenimonas donghaensis DSM 18148 = HO3-R19]